MEQSTYQKIVQNSLEVTGSRIVVFALLDPTTQRVRTLAWAGQPLGAAQRGLEVVQRVLPGWDPMKVDHAANANPLVTRVYIGGEAVSASVRDIAASTVDTLVIVAGETVLGIHHGFLCPLKAGDEILGSLGFYGTAPITDQERRVCEAFVREASLTVENARLVERVREQVKHLQDARRRVSEAEERQRQEIAELLHSRVQSNLLLLWNKLGGARDIATTDPERARAMLLEAQNELDEIRERDIRQASYLLHPAIIRVGLIPALRSLAARFESLLTVSVVTDAEVARVDDPLHNQLAEEFRVSIYRIVEEALNNIQRHAEATRATLILGIPTRGKFLLELADDGRGFDVAAVRPGLGLTVIDDRVEQLGGAWAFQSVPGTGTTLRVEVPLGLL
jgi:signal transduction histidine kinase